MSRLGDEDGFTSGGDDALVTVSGASTWTFDGDVNISNLVVDAAVTWAGDANAGVQIDAELTIGEDGTLALGEIPIFSWVHCLTTIAPVQMQSATLVWPMSSSRQQRSKRAVTT